MVDEARQTSNTPTFAGLLRQHRIAAALSQEALAERAGLSARAISDLERGIKKRPYLETVRMLADALDLPPPDRNQLISVARPENSVAPHGIQRHEHGELPIAPNALIGREHNTEQVCSLLRSPSVRIVTLTGPGGVGKTRLALAAGERMRTAFPDGVRFVPLAPIDDPRLVLPTIARCLGLQDGSLQLLPERLGAHLYDKQLLLLIDNIEHVRSAVPEITRLVRSSNCVKILATSRVVLQISGEHEFPVTPLPVPDTETELPAIEAGRSTAVQLFTARAGAIRHAFSMTDANASAIVAICRRMDGLPLAIELSAARIKIFSPANLLDRLDDQLALLTGGARDAEPRHQTLRNAIAWSYDLLAPDEQRMFRRLSAFRGGWTLEAAESVTNLGDLSNPFETLAGLVDKSLVQSSSGSDAEIRFSMLETVRTFAADQLDRSGESELVCRAHFVCFLSLAEAAGPHIYGERQDLWFDRLERDHGNLRTALEWADAYDEAAALQLGAALWLFWTKRGHWNEGRARLATVLSRSDVEPSAFRTEVLLGAGSLAGVQGDLSAAEQYFTASLDMARQIGSKGGTARAMTNLGIAALHVGQCERAVALLTEAMPLYDSPHDEPWSAPASTYLGLATIGTGETDRGLTLCEEGLERQRAVGDHWALANTSVLVADVLSDLGEYHRSVSLYVECLKEWQRAHEMVLWPLAGLTGVAGATGRRIEAVRLAGAIDAACELLTVDLWPSLAERVSAATATARADLVEERFQAERSLGREMSLAEAVTLAFRLADEIIQTTSVSVIPDPGPTLATTRPELNSA